jgi:hypothetical protein
MDGQGRTDNPEYVGVHSQEWMGQENAPRTLFYPWQYLSHKYGDRYYIIYENGAPGGSTSFDTAGAWERGQEPRHARPSSV